MPMHNSVGIANIYVDMSQKAGHVLTIMPLVKYVYIAHGWTLGYTDNPLIKDHVEAWRHGPVVPKVYRAFRAQGIIIKKKASNILGMDISVERDLTPTENEIVRGVYESYSHLSPFVLSGLTHGDDAPWTKYDGRFYHHISTEEIKEYYKKVVEKQNNVSKIDS